MTELAELLGDFPELFLEEEFVVVALLLQKFQLHSEIHIFLLQFVQFALQSLHLQKVLALHLAQFRYRLVQLALQLADLGLLFGELFGALQLPLSLSVQLMKGKTEVPGPAISVLLNQTSFSGINGLSAGGRNHFLTLVGLSVGLAEVGEEHVVFFLLELFVELLPLLLEFEFTDHNYKLCTRS